MADDRDIQPNPATEGEEAAAPQGMEPPPPRESRLEAAAARHRERLSQQSEERKTQEQAPGAPAGGDLSRHQLRHRRKRLERCRSAEEYKAELAKQLHELGVATPPSAPPSATTAPAPAEPTTAQPAQAEQQVALSPAPQGVTFNIAAGRAGWPSDQDIRQFTPLAAQLVGALANRLHGTRGDLRRTRTIEAFGEKFEVGGEGQLVEALAPVLAKHVPKLVTTPEGNLVLAAGLALGVPAGEWVGEKVGRWWASRGE